MRRPASRTLTALTFIGLIAAAPSFGDSAAAAPLHAKPRHVAQSSCQRLDKAQLVGAVLSMPWFVGNPGPQYIGGCRLRVDPHGTYVPSQYQYNPATGGYDLQ
jgi:hypothetical protein